MERKHIERKQSGHRNKILVNEWEYRSLTGEVLNARHFVGSVWIPMLPECEHDHDNCG